MTNITLLLLLLNSFLSSGNSETVEIDIRLVYLSFVLSFFFLFSSLKVYIQEVERIRPLLHP